MIHKVERLISIGKFRNYNAARPVNFHKLTLLYGDNGGGKTTLTATFRSATTGDPTILRSRISTNHTAPQAAQIIQRIASGDVFHTFNPTSGWNTPFPDIEIFDIHFINENVYSGFDFNDEQRKHLHQFVIGAAGVAIQQQIEHNKNAKTLSRQTQTHYEQSLIAQVGNDLTTDNMPEFLTIQTAQLNNIDPSIASAEAALASANANSTIQTLPLLLPLLRVTTSIHFANLIIDLGTTTQGIQDETLKNLFTNHCQELTENGIDRAENWVKTGYKYIESKYTKHTGSTAPDVHCPFCTQSIADSIEIVKAYTLKFDENFNSLIGKINAHSANVSSVNIDAMLQASNHVNDTNSSRVTTWTSHLPASAQPPNFDIIQDENVLKGQLQALKETIEQKISNPSTSVDANPATIFDSSLQSINSRIDRYNQAVTTYNGTITTFKAGIQSISSAQEEVSRLMRIKKRFEVPIATVCTQLDGERQNLRTLEASYPGLVQQQETAATAFFNSYKTRINHYLGTVFKTSIQIDDVTYIPPRGQAMQSKIGYKLTIDGKDISFTPGQPFSAKECLSEGDKSTIALAFFLSKLDIDPNRQNKILVFDDPLSSLDTNRRTYTISIIRQLLHQMKQVVVLSHSEYFLHEIGKDISTADKKELRITENFVAKASIIEVCDLDELVKNEYFKHIEALEAFRVHPDHSKKDAVLGWLRNVLEAHLRFKFYKELRAITGHQTFGRLIAFLDTSGVIFRNNSNRTSIIANLNLINSVSWKSHHGTASPNFATLGINPNTITPAELDNLIQDTLNLIEVQL